MRIGSGERHAIMKQDDRWLDSYTRMLQDKVVLELGCGPGIDSAVLSKLAKFSVSGDLSPRVRGQGAVIAMDHARPLPFSTGRFDTVVASLCLHYFSLESTKTIIGEISRVLTAQGCFICRLNSYQDENHGAVGYPEIESGLYNVDGKAKRFFREQDIHALWGDGYSLSELVLKTIDRYQKPKSIFEFSAIKKRRKIE